MGLCAATRLPTGDESLATCNAAPHWRCPPPLELPPMAPRATRRPPESDSTLSFSGGRGRKGLESGSQRWHSRLGRCAEAGGGQIFVRPG